MSEKQAGHSMYENVKKSSKKPQVEYKNPSFQTSASDTTTSSTATDAENVYETLKKRDINGNKETPGFQLPQCCHGRGLVVMLVITGVAVTLLVVVAIGLTAASWARADGEQAVTDTGLSSVVDQVTNLTIEVKQMQAITQELARTTKKLYLQGIQEVERRNVSFSAYDAEYHMNGQERLRFREVRYNYGGHYDLETGEFICPYDGQYFFMLCYDRYFRYWGSELTLRADSTLLLEMEIEPYIRRGNHCDHVYYNCKEQEIIYVMLEDDDGGRSIFSSSASFTGFLINL